MYVLCIKYFLERDTSTLGEVLHISIPVKDRTDWFTGRYGLSKDDMQGGYVFVRYRNMNT